jgi:hypothetical protein
VAENFIDAFLHHTRNYESPGSFWQFSAFATIAAVLRDSCYRRQGDSYLYPNIYVLLLADSSGHRKGRPIDMCEMLTHSIGNTKVIGGSSSVQALVDELAHTESDPRTGKIKKAGSGIFIAQELSAALVEDPRAMKILTDIYDYKPQGYAVRLISRATSKIDKLTLSFFGASNEAMLKGLFDQAAVYGGFLARTFLVMPNEFRPSNSLWESEATIKIRQESFKRLVELLKCISNLSGEFTFNEAAQKEYDDWYKPFRLSYKKKPDKSGVTGRIHTSVLKIAMILAANELSMEVKREHIERAIEVCIGLLPNYNVFVMTQGNSTIKEAGTIVLEELLIAENNCLSRKLLLQRHWADFDNETLDKVTATFQSAGLLNQITQSNGEVLFQLTEKCKEMMKAKGGE